MPRSRPKFTQEQVIDALKSTHGMVYLAAERLRTSHQLIYNYMQRYPAIRDVHQAETGKLVDIGELKLHEAVMAREGWAVTLLLKTKGKDRGYVERQEQTGPDGGPIQYVELPAQAPDAETWWRQHQPQNGTIKSLDD